MNSVITLQAVGSIPTLHNRKTLALEIQYRDKDVIARFASDESVVRYPLNDLTRDVGRVVRGALRELSAAKPGPLSKQTIWVQIVAAPDALQKLSFYDRPVEVPSNTLYYLAVSSY